MLKYILSKNFLRGCQVLYLFFFFLFVWVSSSLTKQHNCNSSARQQKHNHTTEQYNTKLSSKNSQAAKHSYKQQLAKEQATNIKISPHLASFPATETTFCSNSKKNIPTQQQNTFTSSSSSHSIQLPPSAEIITLQKQL